MTAESLTIPGVFLKSPASGIQHFHVLYISKHTDELLVLLLVEKGSEMRHGKTRIVKYEEVTVPDLEYVYILNIFWIYFCEFAHPSENKSSGLWSVHNREMSVVRGGVGILGSWHPSGISWLFGITQVLGGYFTELLQGREGAQYEGLMSKELLRSTSGAWLWICSEQGKNVTMYLNHWFYEWFPCSVSCMKCESSPHQRMGLFKTKGLGNTPSKNG